MNGERDIGEASFPTPPHGIVPEAIVGEDERAPIVPTTAYPYRAIASLLIVAADDSRWIGTGWFISPRTVITAGHVVCIKGNVIPRRNGFVKSIEVIPGRNGNERPFGSAVSNTFRAPDEWSEDGNANHDYGAILLDTPLGDAVGAFGFGVYTDAELLAVTANVSGYPDDKTSGTQWFHSRKLATVNALKVFYEVDTAGGQSGSPVWRIINRRRFAFAIHAYGGRSTNSGTRITQEVHDNLMAWKT
jgi:V8-like Glu-specific endopeptidase